MLVVVSNHTAWRTKDLINWCTVVFKNVGAERAVMTCVAYDLELNLCSYEGKLADYRRIPGSSSSWRPGDAKQVDLWLAPPAFFLTPLEQLASVVAPMVLTFPERHLTELARQLGVMLISNGGPPLRSRPLHFDGPQKRRGTNQRSLPS